MDPDESVTPKAISQAVGKELRRTREARGLSRENVVDLLPSPFCSRSVLACERGDRTLSIPRMVELCQPLQVSPPDLLGAALQRAGLYLENLTLRVDLRELLKYRNLGYEHLLTWAEDKLTQATDGVVAVGSTARRELAELMSCDHNDLAHHLAQFVPLQPTTTRAA